VQLADHSSVGCIVKIDVASFRVLTQRGVVETIKLQEIGAKRFSKYAAALDSASNQLSRDDVVVVHSGEHRGQQGTIKHIFRHFLFLFSRAIKENSGIFVASARQVTLVGHKTERSSSLSKSSLQSRGFGLVPSSPHVGGPEDKSLSSSSRGPLRAERVGDLHPLLGKTVTIIKGPYKSFMGVVKEANEMSLAVELHALARKIMVSHDQVLKREPTTNIGVGFSSRGSIGGQTPLLSMLGARTPASDLQGFMTPALGSQTPAHGAQTPSRDAWSAQTPARNFEEDEEQDAAWGGNQSVRMEDEDEEAALDPSRGTQEEEAMIEEEEEEEEAKEPEIPLLPVGSLVDFVDDAGNELQGEMIRHHPSDGSCTLSVKNERGHSSEMLVTKAQRSRLRAVRPQKKRGFDQVIVVSGAAHLGQLGKLIGINKTGVADDAIVNLDGEIVILSLLDLAVYRGT